MDLAQQALELCRIRSPIGSEQQIADYVEKWARGVWPTEHVYRHGHSLILGSLMDPRPTVGLFGHLDTVPERDNQGAPRIEGDRLIGLGSSDMKGGLAVMMGLGEAFARNPSLPLNLTLVFYEREEGPYAENGLGPLFDQKREELRRLRFAVALEPTDNVIQVGCLGAAHATLRFRGRSAHSARPWQGENAIHKAGSLLTELNGLKPHDVEFSGFKFREVFSVTRASGGRARNVVPDLFELNLNYRFAPGKSLSTAERDIEQLVKGRAEIEVTDLAPAGRVCVDNPLFQRFASLTRLPTEPKQAWTDVARLSNEGVDAINFGPGETAQAHQTNESASISALQVAYQKLEMFLSSR